MSFVQVQGRDLPINSKGFLADFAAWNEDVAKAIAAGDGLELTDCHWAAIRYLRDFFTEFEVPPSPRLVIQNVGEKLAHGRTCTRKTLEALFPKGGCKQACRIAGLPAYYCHSC
jgi:tRNA 2-thiouridine synthesizing protein E